MMYTGTPRATPFYKRSLNYSVSGCDRLTLSVGTEGRSSSWFFPKSKKQRPGQFSKRLAVYFATIPSTVLKWRCM